MLKKWSSRPYILWSIIFIVVPLLMIIGYSITIKDPINGNLILSLENFNRFLSPIFIRVFIDSIILAMASTILCLIIGYPVAFILSSMTKSNQNFFLFLIIVPMWMNFLLRTYALRLILGNNGLINKFLTFINFPNIQLLYNELAIMIGMVYNFLPFMILPIYTVLIKIDPLLIDAAYDLGANDKKVFIKVILPLSFPGVIAGVTMVFMPAMSSFVIPSLLGGNKINLIGNIIEEQFVRMGNWHFGSAVSIILIVFILISMGIMNKYDREEGENIIW
jgi:spermidine/putrescine transport system permease protein